MKTFLFTLLTALAGVNAQALIETKNILIVHPADSISLNYFQNSLSGKVGYTVTALEVNSTVPLNLTQQLYDVSGKGKYSSIIFSDGEPSHLDELDWKSTLSPEQWQEFNDYEQKFRIKRLMFNTFPNAEKYGTKFVSGSSESTLYPEVQFVSSSGDFSYELLLETSGLTVNFTSFNEVQASNTSDGSTVNQETLDGSTTITTTESSETTNLRKRSTTEGDIFLSAHGLHVYKAAYDSSKTWSKVFMYADERNLSTSVAGVITELRDSSQMIFHFPCADWSETCKILADFWIPWLTTYKQPTQLVTCVSSTTGNPVTSYSNTDGKVELSCSLNKWPEAAVDVKFASTNLAFSQSGLLVFPANSLDPLKISLESSLTSCPSKIIAYSASITISSTDPDFQGQLTPSLNMIGNCLVSFSLYAWGDPHFNDFNGKRHDFMGIGTWVLLESKLGLKLTGSYYHCNSRNLNVACLNSISVQYGNSVIVHNRAVMNRSIVATSRYLGDAELKGMKHVQQAHVS